MDKKSEERESLRNIIAQWNANRLDLFEISEPNEDLEFHGVMRFYFQDTGQRVATKCIRVASTATTQDVINTLIEKFRPDIRMLSVSEYAIYEIHESGDERKLADHEMPLLVQLNWHRDDREGRFLLRRMDEKTYLPGFDTSGENMKRKLSKREKKEKKKREKKEKAKGSGKGKDSLAGKLYNELPETSFTRSISNPEAVMRRRRQQKLEKRLQQFSEEGGSEAGGTLRIFGESINKDVPYKTILLSTRDTAAHAVKEILEKYGKDKEDPALYCLVQLIVPVSNGDINMLTDLHNASGIREYILDDDDCPLAIEKSHNKSRGVLTFHIRRRPADYQPRKRKKKPKQIKGEIEAGYTKYDEALEKLPYLLETNPDGSEIIRGVPKKHYLYLNVTEVGSDRSNSTNHSQCLQLLGPNVQLRHCVIAHTEGIVTVTPSSREAETYVDGNRIYETTILQHGMLVRFGKLHTFKYVDPGVDKRKHELFRMSTTNNLRKMSDDLDFATAQSRKNYEANYDHETFETTSTTSKDEMSKKSDDTGTTFLQTNGFPVPQGQLPSTGSLRKGTDPILPAILELWEEGEDAFLNMIISRVDPNQVQFMLAITYTVYMAVRYRASTHFKPEITPNERAHRLTNFTTKLSNMIHQNIQDHYRDSLNLAFWLANSSELLHFLKQDRHLSAYTFDAQDILAEGVQLAFRNLVMCQQLELENALPSFLDACDDENEDESVSTSTPTLNVLTNAMTLLRRCRVNAALTIQLLSQLFHFINMWIFNQIVGFSQTNVNYCSRQWGLRLKKRLARIESWAEKLGLELAAECHLSRVVQAAHLLQLPKSNPEDISSITSTCFKLNSLQLRAIFDQYEPEANEMPIPRELVESVIKVAANTSDELARNDGREIRLEEEPDLQLPFLLPEDGYFCDILRGVPSGLQEFIFPLIQANLCHLTVQQTSSGYWTIYMNTTNEFASKIGPPPVVPSVPVQSSVMPSQGNSENQMNSNDHQTSETSTEPATPTMTTAPMSMNSLMNQTAPPPPSGRLSAVPLSGEPEIHVIQLKKSNNGMGLSIVAARGLNQERLGIYIKSVVKGGAADQDGRLTAGDQLLKVDGQPLIGISQERAAELMTQTGPVVTLEVAKQGAIFHGLAGILSQPSPMVNRGHGNPRRMSERDIPSKISQEQEIQMRGVRNGFLPQAQVPRIQGSKSVPTLNTDQNMVNSQMMPPRRAEPMPSPQMHPNAAYTMNATSSIPKSYSDYNNSQQQFKMPENVNTYPRNYAAQQGPVANCMNFNNSPARPDSQLSFQSSQQANRISSTASQSSFQEERHYQNIQMYQLPPQNSQMPAKLSPVSQASMGPVPQQRILHSSHSSLHHPDGQYNVQHANRPLSALISSREQDQYINAGMYPHQQPPTPTSPRPPPPHQSFNQDAFNQPHPNSHGSFPKQIDYHRQVSNNEMRGVDSQDYNSHQRSFASQPPFLEPRQRDLLRQEAKMEEMRDEVRRREERLHQMNAQQMGMMMRGPNNISWQRPPPTHLQPAAYPQYPMNGPMRMGPPPAPKPRAQFGPPQFAPNARHLVYREQDMINTNQPPPAVSYRFGPSGYPPSRPGESSKMPQVSRTQQNSLGNRPNDTRSGVVSPSPWEREEREKARLKRIEDAKRSRDEEIVHLESLPYRTARQEERLKTLILEKEFQKRADEVREDEEDDDEEVLDRADHRERMLSMHQELERTRQRRIEREQMSVQQKTSNEEWSRKNNVTSPQIEEQEVRLRQLRIEEVKRRKELEAAHQAEEKLIREARRRQQEEDARNQTKAIPQRLSKFDQMLSQNLSQKSGQNEIPPPLPKSPPPLEAPQRLDRLLLSSHYPNEVGERKAFDTKSSLKNGENLNNDVGPSQSMPKKVSFNDVPASYDSTNGNDSSLSNGPDNSFTLQDIDDVLGTSTSANSWLSNSYVSGNTPGVIGAQEVYNDPRQRIEAERLKLTQNQKPNHVGPEKLSFKEKMKMFAMESGQETPKDKMKTSKAQREIETNFDGTPKTSDNATNAQESSS